MVADWIPMILKMTPTFLLSVLAIVVAVITPLPGNALPWEEAIEAVESRSEEIWQLAKDRGLEGRHLGTVHNEIHANEHTCTILGRMLDKVEYIESLERSTDFELTNLDPHTTGLAAQSLGNWVFIAKKFLQVSRNRKIQVWNLDCVGMMGIPTVAYIELGDDETFFDIDGSTLRILGDIEPGFFEKLRAEITLHPEVRVVSLGSGGGSVYEAIRSGLLIRSLNLDTSLWNNCYSACTIVFIAGVERKVWSPYPDLAFHQVSLDGSAVPFDDRVYNDLAEYSDVLGVEPSVFLGLMQSAPPSDFFVPIVSDLCDLKLATWVQRICGW